MGLTVVLQDENGKVQETVTDSANMLHRLLPHPENHSFQCLRHIDWYGDTTFNRLQMEQFLVEWRCLRSSAKNPQEHELLNVIERLALKCQQQEHAYLKFYGD